MSRADHEDRFVTELDGQPRAFMELTDGSSTVRFVYRVMYFLSPSEAVANQMLEDAQVTLHVELKKIHGDSVIFWRRRPEKAIYDPDHRVWRSSMRLATSPPLSPEAWHRIGWTPVSFAENHSETTAHREAAA